MKRLLQIITTEERGSVLITVTLALVALLGVSALVVDAGLAYAERVKLSNTVDAAALAGAQEMASSLQASLAESTAREYASLNAPNLDLNDLVVQVDEETKKVTVAAQKTMDLFFARVLDFFQVDIGARAAAIYQYPTSINQVKNGNVLPLFIAEDIYDAAKNEDGSINEDILIGLMGEDNFHIKIDGQEVPGNWGGLDLGGGGTSSFREAMEGTMDAIVSIEVNEWFEEGTKTGALGINVKKAVDDRLDADDIPPYGLIPVVSAVEDKGGGKVEVFVSGFTVFNITHTQHEPPGWTIYGHLLNDASEIEHYGSTTEDENYDYGARVLTLVE